MDKVFLASAKPRFHVAVPRGPAHRVASGGLAVCFWLWITGGCALAATAPVHRSEVPGLAAPLVGGSEMPPAPGESFSSAAVSTPTGRPAAPDTLARPRRSRATPSPSPGADATPAASPGVTANQGGAASPAAPPSDEFTGKYEAAYAKFLEKNYPDTLSLLDEADKVQPGQPQTVTLRFKAHYALAYLEYRKQNYPGALAHLDDADRTQKNADSFNLRGLIFSKQHNYDQAETMFHKAVTTDPALWAAKFNYAELPFNRGNYTDARTRFEELFSQTDSAKQPREAELTQYKVFLTLLLEGKVEAASTFMDHLTFSGATPARYFCNAALNFRAGSVDKAKNWIDDAKKEYPPQLVAIFIESFYRLGWMTDPNAPPGTMLAQATPAGTAAVTASGTQPTTSATATAPPLLSPAPSVVAAATPIIVAAASPTPTPLAAAATPKPTPTPAPTVAVAAATPKPTPVPTPTPTVAIAVVTPRPTASVTPAAVVSTPAVTPRPTALAVTTPTPTPARTVAPAVVVAIPPATPARTVALASATPTPASTVATARVTPAPTVTPSNDLATESARKARQKARVHLVVLGLLLVQFAYYVMAMRGVFLRRKEIERRAAARKRALTESSK